MKKRCNVNKRNERGFIIWRYIKYIGVLFASFAAIYIVIYTVFRGDGFFSTGKNLEKRDWLNFLGVYLTFGGTVGVSFLSLAQGVKYNRQENARRRKERFEAIQPIFSVEIAHNKQVPGTAEAFDLRNRTQYNNTSYMIENVGAYPVSHVIIFDKYRKNVLKPGDKIWFTCAYYDSEDAQRWSKLITVLTDEYTRGDDNIPDWFNICYEDIDGNNVFQTFKLNSFDGKYYYSLESKELT